MTITQAAALAGVAGGTIRYWIKKGWITGHKGKRSPLHVKRSELLKFLQDNPAPPYPSQPSIPPDDANE